MIISGYADIPPVQAGHRDDPFHSGQSFFRCHPGLPGGPPHPGAGAGGAEGEGRGIRCVYEGVIVLVKPVVRIGVGEDNAVLFTILFRKRISINDSCEFAIVGYGVFSNICNIL